MNRETEGPQHKRRVSAAFWIGAGLYWLMAAIAYVILAVVRAVCRFFAWLLKPRKPAT